MEYIVGLHKPLIEEEKVLIENYSNQIIYESKLVPIIGVDTNLPEKIEALSFVKYIREPEIGEYQDGDYLSTIIFEPHIKKSVLVNNQLLGWGDTRIVVIDSGVNDDGINIVEHIDYTGTGTQDTIPHGTIVTKIIKHFAKGANIYSAKVGPSKPNELYVMRAIDWALDKGANIINISSGFKRKKSCVGNCELCELVNSAVSQGVAVVIAAGNNDNKVDSIECPGVAINGITVGALDKNCQVADYSSFGRIGSVKPNILCPGTVYIDGYLHKEGTSFAAPVLSGILGAILSRVGNVSKATEYIYKTASNLGLPSHHQGLGAINLEKLVEVVMNETANIKSERQE